MPTLKTTLGTIHFQDLGSGDPLVLLHAVLHSSHDYAPVIPSFSKTHRVLALDWPGHGESEMPKNPEKLSAKQMGDVLLEFVTALSLRNACYIGNSLGGYAAARLATERPEWVRGLVL